jgi:hypothetical protein
MVSDPAACPYCVQENFGVVYTPPPWRAGIGSEGSASPLSQILFECDINSVFCRPHRRGLILLCSLWKRVRHPRVAAGVLALIARMLSPLVSVLWYCHTMIIGHRVADQIRPDWEAKLAAIQATAQRRANRRIIMRQVGDRLIPVGITSGRVHALPPEEVENAEALGSGSGSRRSRRRQQNADLQQILGQVGMAGQDLEEVGCRSSSTFANTEGCLDDDHGGDEAVSY